jgi:hypothetical protein
MCVAPHGRKGLMWLAAFASWALVLGGLSLGVLGILGLMWFGPDTNATLTAIGGATMALCGLGLVVVMARRSADR